MPPRKEGPARPGPAPPAPAAPRPELPLGGPRGVRLCLEGADSAAVEAAAAELKARFGARFAVTGRRAGGGRAAPLRISATLLVRADDALDAEAGP